MLIRGFRRADIPKVDEIWKKHHSHDFSVPNRNNAVIDAIVAEGDRVIAYGQVRMFAEAMFILDKDATKRERVQALKLLMLEALRGTNNAGIEQLYAFIKDPEFATLIVKHFAFEIVDEPGELLLREV